MSTERHPETRRAARMAPLATLPLFLKLDGRRVVLAGGDEPAVWKAELLAASGAAVHVYALAPCQAMEALAADPPSGTVTVHRRPWATDVFAGAAFAVGAIDNDDEAQAFRCAAKAAGVVVNVVDRPQFCDVAFGSIVNRSPLVIGISTDGAAPVFGQAVRAKIEAILPAGLARWANAARQWRARVQASALPFQARRRFWELFATRALQAPDAQPHIDDADAMLATARQAAAAGSGRIILVGAGPGDPELLTLKAVRALQSADVIIHDDLISAGVLDMARREAERIAAGKKGHGPSCNQAEINALMIDLARQGKRVIRLKSGDPMIFGRAGEEIAAAKAAGIPTEVVPGISAAQGAASSLSLSLTHRDAARRIQYITAHGRDGRLPKDLCWGALADPTASTVIYMARATWPELAGRLMAHGLAGATPAIAVVRATQADEHITRATLATLATHLPELPDGPTLMLVGQAFSDPALLAQARAAAPFRPLKAAARSA